MSNTPFFIYWDIFYCIYYFREISSLSVICGSTNASF